MNPQKIRSFLHSYDLHSSKIIQIFYQYQKFYSCQIILFLIKKS